MPLPQNRSEDGLPTRRSLLNRIRDPADSASWSDFAHTYERLVYRVAQQAGLNHHECEEVVQETIISVSRHIAEFEYRPNECSFKTWLLNITRWRIIDQVRKRNTNKSCIPFPKEELAPTHPDLIDQIADPNSTRLDELWETEWREHLLKQALEIVKTKVSADQFQIFHLLQVRGWSVSQIQKQLGVSATKIYLAKHRIGRIVQSEVKRLQNRFH